MASSSTTSKKYAVTGVYGFIGKHIAQKLLESGARVVGITNSKPPADTRDANISTVPYDFDEPSRMVKALEGAEAFVNTYWIRHSRPGLDYERALQNTKTLLAAAAQAGVKKVVHIGVANSAEDANYEYYIYKAKAERAVKECGLLYTVLKPPLVLGRESALLNNMVWAVRRFPILPVFVGGHAKMSVACVEDLARLAAQATDLSKWNGEALDVVGPQTYSYASLLKNIARALNKKRLLMPVPLWLGIAGSKVLNLLLRDTLLTATEVKWLTDGYLYSSAKPLGTNNSDEWLARNVTAMGKSYSRNKYRSR